MQKFDEILRQLEIEVEFVEPFDDEYELINLDILRRNLYENYQFLTEEQRERLQEIDKKALEIYYRNLNNKDKTVAQLIYNDIIEEYILGKRNEKNRDK